MRCEFDPIKLAAQINLSPNSKQIEIIQSVLENDVTVVKATRRGGKSLISALCAATILLTPQTKVNILAPTLNLTDIIFNNVIEIMIDKCRLKKDTLNYKDHILEFEWGTTLRAASFKNIKQVLGVSNDLFIIDEAALIDADDVEFLFQDIIPTLLQNNGHLLIVSTPRGLNWFYDIYKKAETEPRWKAIEYTIYDVDHIDREAIERLRKQYVSNNMEVYWEQEFEVKFTVFEGKIYKFSPTVLPADFVLPDDCEFFLGIDPGAAHKFAVIPIAISESTGVYILDSYCTTGSTSEHAEAIQRFIDKYQPLEIYIDYAAKQTSVDLAYEHDISCRNANKSVDPGINFIRCLHSNLFIIEHDGMDEFLKEWSLYRIKNNVIVKRDDDRMDAFRYAVYTAYLDFYIGQLAFVEVINDDSKSNRQG